ncbi:MAG: chloride channel protein [Anaerolineae bacterium]
MWQRIQRWWNIARTDTAEGYMVCPNCGQLSPVGRCTSCDFDAADPAAVARLRVERARLRASQRAWVQRHLGWANPLLRIDWHEHGLFLRMLLRWVLLGTLVGILAGTASAVFLISLQWATNLRLEFPSLLFLLPFGGLLIGWTYYRFAGEAARGNNLVIEEVNLNRGRIPLRMAPMILAGTVLTHLFGGSAGREGTAIQMGTSLADGLRRLLGLTGADRRMMLMAGISGGFASVFGTPLAGFVFGMEVQSMGRIRYEGVIPCLTAALVGDLVTRAWGAAHSHYPALPEVAIDPTLLLKVTLAGIGFGLTSLLFIELTDSIRHVMRERVRWMPLRPLIGGAVIIALTLLLGTRDYLGLSLPLIQNSVNGTGVETFAFLLKLVFTAITLGTGFLGGEVTPLFVIGLTLFHWGARWVLNLRSWPRWAS